MKSYLNFLTLIIAFVLLITNVFLIWQNLELRSQLKQVKLPITEEGYKFSELKAFSAEGKEEIINLANNESKTVLLVFRTSCSYCKQQYPIWKDFSSKLDLSRWKVFLVTTENNYESVRGYLEENELGNIKVLSVSSEDAQNARMVFTPMTIAINERGEVEKVWTGLWDKESTSSVLRFFGLG